MVASCCPNANGQVEMVNRTLGPMLSKLCDKTKKIFWPQVLSKIEYGLNNAVSKSANTTPAKLIFGVNQRGEFNDRIKEYLEDNVSEVKQNDFDEIRKKTSKELEKAQT